MVFNGCAIKCEEDESNEFLQQKVRSGLFGIVVILSALVEGGIIFMGDVQVLYLVLMWVPALAALAANIVRLKEAEQRITPKTLVGRFCCLEKSTILWYS